MDKAFYNSPLGWIEICTNTNGVTHIHFVEKPQETASKGTAFLDLVVQQLDNYFTHNHKTFSFPLDPSGTEFQLTVWKLLEQIPHGTTIP